MKKYFLFILIFGTIVNAQQAEDFLLSGMLSYDSKISFIESEKINFSSNQLNDNYKSPFLASVLSFAVPGAGQFYAGNYWKTAAFIAIEAAAITVGLMYDKKGDDQTSFFENYAEQNWDVKQYARWTIANIATLNASVNPADYNVFDNNGNVNWNELNRMETAIGGYYSHRLAPFRDQQYYEMIGKYPQFNPGWNDFGDENKPFSYGDPLTEKFHYYAKERGKANDYYNIASKAVLVIVVNHIISAVDAAWTTSNYNKSLELSTELKKFELGYNQIYYPQLNLRYSF